MIPREPPRNPQFGFLYLPPYRVQGYSVAGEETFVQIPELDLCFDIGRAPRLSLSSGYIALSHGHMDHTAGLVYYFSQRHFQGMGTGTVLCHPSLVEPIRRLMNAWVDIEAQRTPYYVHGMEPGEDSGEIELKKHVYLRAFPTDHTVPSLGFVVVERRSKLKEKYLDLPQEKLVELKKSGEEITYTREIPQIAYMGDTGPGTHFWREDVANARILITECTFLERGHQERARIGKHLHLNDLVKLLPKVHVEHIVLTHLSRRTHLGQARQQLDKAVPSEHRDRLHILMDHRTNRARYQRQLEEARAAEGGEEPSKEEKAPSQRQ